MSPRITMAQVASRAGVHPTTVSLALRNHPSIPPMTRERIREVAVAMGYRPDPALTALTAYRHSKLSHRGTPPLAYLTNYGTEWGWKQSRSHAGFHDGAAIMAHELGHRLEHFWLGAAGMSHQRMSDILFARGITGVIVASQPPEKDHSLDLDWSKFSAVTIDCLARQPPLHHVADDQRAILQMAMARTLAAGYRRIGLVMPRWWDESSDFTWSAAYLAEQQRLPPDDRIPILHFPGEPMWVEPGAREALVPKRLLEDWIEQHRPEVLVSSGQFVETRLEELGLVVPRDLAFVELCLVPDGRTAGIRHNCDRVGALAVEFLVGQMQRNTIGVPEYPISMLVEGTWFDGGTLPALATLELRRDGSIASRNGRHAESLGVLWRCCNEISLGRLPSWKS